MQDGKNSDYYYIHQFAGQISELTDGLTAAGLKAISEPIHAYTICVLLAQLSSRSTIVGTNASTLDAQPEIVNTVEVHIKRPIDLSADIARYQSILSNASSHLNFALAPGLYLIPQDLALKTDSTFEYNNKLLQAPPSAFGTVEINSVKKRSNAKIDATGTITTTSMTNKATGRPQDSQKVSRIKYQYIYIDQYAKYGHRQR